jgi:hypothetical protein
MVDSLVEWLDKLAARTEDLQLIVFCCAHHHPWVILVPVEVANAVGETTVHEEPTEVSDTPRKSRFMCLQFWRAILGLLLGLLIANLTKIPHVDSAVITGTCEDSSILRMPLQTDDISTMT